ncbi:MAG TPA: transporter [Nitrospira sp.]|nr:transporter [Nitrospira sp.]
MNTVAVENGDKVMQPCAYQLRNVAAETSARMAAGYAQVVRLRGKTPRDTPGPAWAMRMGIALAAALLCMGEGMGGWAIGAEDEGSPKPASPWRVSATVNYSSGSYGTESRTNILYAPLTIRRVFQKGDVSVTIPFVSISGTGAVRLVDGVPTRTGNVSGATGATAGTGSGRGGRGKSPGASPLSSTTTDSGLGDIILRGRYYLIEESTILPLVALTGRIKFPTADADRGLGTGEFDEGVGVELTKSFFDRWQAFLDGGYIFIGDAPDTNFNNRWWYDIGLGYDITDTLHVSLLYEEYRTLVNTVNNARDVLALANYVVTDRVRVTGSALAGLSNGAPNYGLGAGVTVRF